MKHLKKNPKSNDNSIRNLPFINKTMDPDRKSVKADPNTAKLTESSQNKTIAYKELIVKRERRTLELELSINHARKKLAEMQRVSKLEKSYKIRKNSDVKTNNMETHQIEESKKGIIELTERIEVYMDVWTIVQKYVNLNRDRSRDRIKGKSQALNKPINSKDKTNYTVKAITSNINNIGLSYISNKQIDSILDDKKMSHLRTHSEPHNINLVLTNSDVFVNNSLGENPLENSVPLKEPIDMENNIRLLLNIPNSQSKSKYLNDTSKNNNLTLQYDSTFFPTFNESNLPLAYENTNDTLSSKFTHIKRRSECITHNNNKKLTRSFSRVDVPKLVSLSIFANEFSNQAKIDDLSVNSDIKSENTVLENKVDIDELKPLSLKPRLTKISSKLSVSKISSFSQVSLKTSERHSVVAGIDRAINEIRNKIRVPMVRGMRNSVQVKRTSINIGACTDFINTRVKSDVIKSGFFISNMKWYIDQYSIKGFKFSFNDGSTEHEGIQHGQTTDKVTDINIKDNDKLISIYYIQDNSEIKCIKFITEKQDILYVGICLDEMDEANEILCHDLPNGSQLSRVMSYFNIINGNLQKFYLGYG